MLLRCVVICFCFLSLTEIRAQSILDTTVEFNYQKQTLADILADIQNRYQTRFSYKVFDLSLVKSIQFEGRMEEGLARLLHPENIVFKAIGNLIVLRLNPAVGKRLKGTVIDVDTKIPLIGANVEILNQSTPIGTATDIEGRFAFDQVFVGRYDLQIQYLGYETQVVPQVLVTSGKEVNITISLKESAYALNEVVVIGKRDLRKPINEMASNSARSFSVEESQRFAAAIADPARMAQSYAGVSSGGDDLSNEIIIRGNSARGLLWRLEGVEIPSPNHFAGYISGGGSISMLSSNTLTNSDFYTGAFPAEFGNALSGVFDLRMRAGNHEKREHSISVGNLGLEAATEGYFSKNSDASYLIHYRYSTLQLIDRYLTTVGDALPRYRDLSFKLHFPGKQGSYLSIFGIAGYNDQTSIGKRDTSLWMTFRDITDFYEEQELGILGATLHKTIGDKGFLQFSLMGSAYLFYDLTDLLIAEDNFAPLKIDESIFDNYDIIFTGKYQYKPRPKHLFTFGISVNPKWYTYDFRTTNPLIPLATSYETRNAFLQPFLMQSGSALLTQGYGQWKYRFADDWTIHSGLNVMQFSLNRSTTVDPRLALLWDVKPNQTLGLSLGLHSKPEHGSTYLFQDSMFQGTDIYPNIQLKTPRSVHAVLSYDYRFAPEWRLKAEAYYQYLFNIPVSSDPMSSFSILNNSDIFGILFDRFRAYRFLVSEGVGRNIGLDLTLEKFFSEGYYFLATASVYASNYQTLSKEWYPTIHANNLLTNLLGGKEWIFDRRFRNILGLNGKFTLYGGRRDQPIDLAQSILEEGEVNPPDQFFGDRLPNYVRLDFGVSYKINTGRKVHTWSIDLQNVLNRNNVFQQYYDPISQNVEFERQNGLIPFLTYRLEFASGDRVERNR